MSAALCVLQVWCYVCGLDCDSDECDKAPNQNMSNCYRHNVNWAAREGRCPMYLTEIHEVDDTWPEEDGAAKERLDAKTERLKRELSTSKQRVGELEREAEATEKSHQDALRRRVRSKNCAC